MNVPKFLQEAGWHVWDLKEKRPRVPSPSAPYAKPRQARPYQECVAFAESRRWGIGIQMASIRGLVGIDFDGCAGEDWVEELIGGHLTYLSPSGTGYHVFVRGRVSRGREWAHPDGRPHHGFGIYPGGQARFLTLGEYHSGTLKIDQPFLDALIAKYFEPDPPRPEVKHIAAIAEYYERCFPDTGLIPFLQESTDQWGKLWRGDWSKYASQSEADLALATHLAFEYVGPNPERLETLMTASGLCREKWIDRDDYRDRTITKAIRGYLASPVFVADLYERLK